MKYSIASLFLLLALRVQAESPCDIRPGTSVGVKVVEFTSGHVIHSKMPLRESTADALLEEMVNLQDMGVCEEKITAQKCTLKYEKLNRNNFVSMYRGRSRWNTWNLSSKEQAQSYVKSLKKAGFCS